MTLEIEVIDSEAAFAGLAAEWNALVERYRHANVFLLYEWLASSWVFLHPGRTLRILALRNGTRLVGALPLAVETVRWRHLDLRRLAFLTDPLTANVRGDFILPEQHEDGLRALGTYLLKTRADWDVCELDSVPEHSPLLGGYGLLQAAGRLRARFPEKRWVLHWAPLKGSWEEHLERLGPRTREHLRQERRYLGRFGVPQIAMAERPDEVRDAVEAFFRIEALSSKRRRADYTPLDTRSIAYYRALYGALAAAGVALIGVLSIDGRMVCIDLATSYRRVVCSLNVVYDPAYAAGEPGHFMRAEMLRCVYETGFETLDFNGYGPHIRRWGTVGQPCYRLLFYSSSALGTLLEAYKHRFVPFVRRFVAPRWLPPAPPVRPGDRGVEFAA